MRDYDTFTECMNREPINIIKKKPPTKTPPKEYGKAKGKSKTRWTPYPKHEPRRNDSNYYEDRGSCNSSSSSYGHDKSSWQNDSWNSDWKK